MPQWKRTSLNARNAIVRTDQFRDVIATFRVYPGRILRFKSQAYWQVLVFKGKPSMHEAYAKMGVRWPLNFNAIVMPRAVQKRARGGEWKTMPHLGYVMFCRTHAGSEVVNHESVHMAVAFLRYCRPQSLTIRNNHKHEEDLCYASGCCARQIVSNFYARGIYGNQS